MKTRDEFFRDAVWVGINLVVTFGLDHSENTGTLGGHYGRVLQYFVAYSIVGKPFLYRRKPGNDVIFVE